MIDVYDFCPRYEGKKYTLRLVEKNDCDDLLKVYSDKKAVPFFNSDNCYGDDFHYTTKERMGDAIEFWIDKFKKKEFVRFTIVDNEKGEAIGTIELFVRSADDAFSDCGVLRLDLRSDYEKETEIIKIMRPIFYRAFNVFKCDRFITKAIPKATERIRALKSFSFEPSEEKLIGHDGTQYEDYWVYKKIIPVWENPPSLTKEENDFFVNFLNEELQFYPSSDKNTPFLPFSLSRQFAVYDIAKMTDEQIISLYDMAPAAFLNCLQEEGQLYFFDWQHNLLLYDPRNPENCRGEQGEMIFFSDDGVALFGGLYPDGDYCFHIERYGKFGYLSHPWREEVWIFGDELIKEFELICEKIGFIPKTIDS